MLLKVGLNNIFPTTSINYKTFLFHPNPQGVKFCFRLYKIKELFFFLKRQPGSKMLLKILRLFQQNVNLPLIKRKHFLNCIIFFLLTLRKN